MMSTNRQHEAVCALLAAIQTCVDRRGHTIPCRDVDFAVYIARAREAMGIGSGASEVTVARELYKSGRP